MSASSPRGAAAGPLVHWLLLVVGLALITVTRFDEPELAPIWLGSIAGMATGQVLARARLRLWLAAIVVGGAMWFFALLVTPFFWSRSASFAWVPAMAASALSGYASLSERGALLGLWYPAVLWMLPILDGHAGRSLADRRSAVLLTGLAALVLFAMRSRESRRVALWQTNATHTLAPPPRSTTLRRAPLRAFARPWFMAVLGAGIALLTAWVAPEMLRRDEVATARALPSFDTTARRASRPGAAVGTRAPCCPEVAPVDDRDERVTELFPIHPARVDEPMPPAAGCVACIAGSPIAAAGSSAGPDPGADAGASVTGASSDDPAGGEPALEAAPGGRTTAATSISGSTTTAAASSPTTPAADTVGTHAAPAAPRLVAGERAVAAPRAASADPVPASPAAMEPLRPSHGAAAREARPPGESPNPFPTLLALVAAAACLHLGVRAVRRQVTLRHLVRPMWRVSVDQRVSNLWELALVGLRDAGFQTSSDEQPNALARRVGLAAMKACATVLERARHGVRVDAADLESMERSAQEVYRLARERAGVVARAVAWLRWPL